jgi:hypothetical protein
MAVILRRFFIAGLSSQYGINHSEEVRVNLTQCNQLRACEFFAKVFKDLLTWDDLCALELRRP